MLMLWAGKLQQLSKKDDGVAYEGVSVYIQTPIVNYTCHIPVHRLSQPNNGGICLLQVKELEKEKQQLSAAAIAKLAQQHEKLLQGTSR